jgi:hypothetical protein
MKHDTINDLRRYADHLRRAVDPTRALAVAARAVGSAPIRGRSFRWVVAAAGAAFLSVGNVAVAAVADSAAPGDILYGVDRAYERLTDLLGAQDRADERLNEAAVLSARGDDVGALGLAIEVLGALKDDDDVAEAVNALNQAADAPGQIRTKELHTATSELVGLMQEMQDLLHAQVAEGDPQSMADLAKAMREKANAVKQAAQALGNQSEGQGQPDDPGAPGATHPEPTHPQPAAPGLTN